MNGFLLVLAVSLVGSAGAQLDWSLDPATQARALLAASPAPDSPPAIAVEAPAEELRFVFDDHMFSDQADTTPLAAVDSQLHCRPEMIAAFIEIWRRAGRGRVEYEAAFRVDRADAGLAFVYAPMTGEPFRLPISIDRARTIAIAHTHPDAALPTPGPGDYASPVPNYVLSGRALYVTVPGTSTHRFLRRDWREPCR